MPPPIATTTTRSAPNTGAKAPTAPGAPAAPPDAVPARYERLNQMRIRTPEGVEFSLLLASPLSRALAWLIDAACMSLAYVAIWSVSCLLLSVGTEWAMDLAMGTFTLVSFLMASVYGMLFEWLMRGQTPGKRAMGLKVIDAHGFRMRFSQVAVRNILRPADMFPLLYLVGGLASWISPRNQRLGDVVANTVVVRLQKVQPVNLQQVLGGKFNSFRHYPHLAARLRQAVDPPLAQLVLTAVQRRELLEPSARVQAYGRIVAYLESLVGFPEDATLGLSDEQYLRNVIDIVFTTHSGQSLQRSGALAVDAARQTKRPATGAAGESAAAEGASPDP